MTELQETQNGSNDTPSKGLFAKFAILSTAGWGLLCLFGLLYHWGLMAGLGIPQEFFPLPFQMMPIKAYLAFITILNKLVALLNETTFMAFPAAIIGTTTLTTFYLIGSERTKGLRNKLNLIRKQAKGNTDKHQVIDVLVSFVFASLVYLGPRVLLVLIGILILIPASGYYIGEGLAADLEIRQARLCLEHSDKLNKATSGCVELIDNTGKTVRGYILAQSEDFIAWYIDDKVEIRPLDKTAIYKVVMKPITSAERKGL
jgi:UPF0716 family protein affecting phage T7 exclusion